MNIDLEKNISTCVVGEFDGNHRFLEQTHVLVTMLRVVTDPLDALRPCESR